MSHRRDHSYEKSKPDKSFKAGRFLVRFIYAGILVLSMMMSVVSVYAATEHFSGFSGNFNFHCAIMVLLPHGEGISSPG